MNSTVKTETTEMNTEQNVSWLKQNYVALTTIWIKECTRFLRIWVQTLVPPAITMSLYFVIFGSLIGNRIGEMGGFTYMEFIVPGLIMMSVITNSYANVSSSFFSAKFQRNIEELKVDVSRMTVSWQNQPVLLTVTEFWMLHALIKRPGHVKSRQQLMDESRMVVDDTTITSHIKRMRKKFVQLDPRFDHIDTVYGMGYRWQL